MAVNVPFCCCTWHDASVVTARIIEILKIPNVSPGSANREYVNECTRRVAKRVWFQSPRRAMWRPGERRRDFGTSQDRGTVPRPRSHGSVASHQSAYSHKSQSNKNIIPYTPDTPDSGYGEKSKMNTGVFSESGRSDRIDIPLIPWLENEIR